MNSPIRGSLGRGGAAGIFILLCLSAGLPCVAEENKSGDISKSLPAPLYHETYRPQFHFSAAHNWLNDANGLVYFQGEFHLFYQHNPSAMLHAGVNMHWGHAVSTDLVHWTELPIALYPREGHQRYSGSAVVDWKNTAGFQKGAEPALLAFHTLTDLGQSVAYSNDRGRTWTDGPDNPLITTRGRDPKVFWHELTQRWIMVFFDEKSFVFYTSQDLRHWEKTSENAGFYECPDLFPLALDGNVADQKWVLVSGSGEYRVGGFDGRAFTPQGPKLRGDWGRNYYATQTWNDVPPADGRRIQIGWMRDAVYPGMPFSQQMSVPTELSLRTFPEGVRLCKVPVRELSCLQDNGTKWSNVSLSPGDNPLASIKGDTVRIVSEIDPGEAAEVGFELRGQRVWYAMADRTIHASGNAVYCAPLQKTLKLDLLLDRTSLECFIDDGRVSFSSCFIAPPETKNLAVFARGGAARIVSMRVYKLASIWPGTGSP